MIHVENIEQYNELISAGKVLVKYGAEWCGPCKMMEPVLEEYHELYNQTYPGITVLSVDVDQIDNEDTKTVRSLPTFNFYNEGEQVSDLTFSGADKNKLQKSIKHLLSL